MSTAMKYDRNNEELRMDTAVLAADTFEAQIAGTQPVIPVQGILAGPDTFDWEAVKQRMEGDPRRGDDNLHFAMNVDTLLRMGFSGIAEAAEEKSRSCQGKPAVFLQAIARCHRAAASFAEAHAKAVEACIPPLPGDEHRRLTRIRDNCRAIGSRAPASFEEAVQLFWFAWCLRGKGTIGRLDQHLYPFFRSDLAQGHLSREEALSILVELWEGFNRSDTGDTLRNLMVAGQDREGRDATNDLSYLMIDAALAVRKPEPHLNVRVHRDTPVAFLDKIVDLQLMGHGQGTIYHDEALIPSLIDKGVPTASARNYSNDGCTEVTIDGESGISFLQMEAMKSLELTLFNGEENVLHGDPLGQYNTHWQEYRTLRTDLEPGYRTGDFTSMTHFDQLYRAFLDQYLHQVGRKLEVLAKGILHSRDHGCSSPFLAGTFPECLRTGCDPFRGGFTIPCHMVFSGSIPTVADSLAAVKQVVFERKLCSPGTLLDALRANFEGYETLRRHCLNAPKFGNDDDYVDHMTADIARRFCDHVTQWPTPTGKPFWPALYNHLFNDFAKTVGATPDGRRWGDPIGEHYSPTPGKATSGPTAVINSAVKGPLAEACGSSIFHISLSRSMAPMNSEGRILLRSLIDGALQQGVAVMNTAIYDVSVLREARANPETHQDLVVRVWGYSARFVDLCEDMQDHIIQRAVSTGD